VAKTDDTARLAIRKLIALTMPLPEEMSNTARPTKRKLVGALEAAAHTRPTKTIGN
jgi:hypothetical protein